MKALKYILYGLVIAATAGLLAYQGLVTKTLDSGNLTKGILIIVGAVVIAAGIAISIAKEKFRKEGK